MWRSVAQSLMVVLLGIDFSRADAEELLIAVPGSWDAIAELKDHDGLAWYRTAVLVPESWAGEQCVLELGEIDDADETFVNGEQVGATAGWNRPRSYVVPADLLRPGAWNTISVRVNDTGGNGGIVRGRQMLASSGGAISLQGAWLIEPGDRMPEDDPNALARRLEENAQDAKIPLVGGMVAGWAIPSTDPPPPQPHLLWYEHPASQWIEALPIGNGRLGGMVHGDWAGTVQLNEDSMWAGSPQDRLRDPPEGALDRARELWFEGRVVESQAIMQSEFMSERRTRSHQTAGVLTTNAIDPTETLGAYRRALDLDTGLAVTMFTAGNVQYRVANFASVSEEVIVVNWSADTPGSLVPAVGVARPGGVEMTSEWDVTSALPRITLQGRAANGSELGVRYAITVMVIAEGGEQEWAASDTSDHAVTITGTRCDSYTVVAAVATDFHGEDPVATSRRQAQEAAEKGFRNLAIGHVGHWKALPGGPVLELPATEQAQKPTDTRLRELAAGAKDPTLYGIYLRYAWYLMISSSRPGALPANLQGLWNEHIAAPWNADYHININLQMNYWPVEAMGLGRYHEPVFDFIECLARRGEETAQRLYGARGWMAHHTSDAWCFTVPIGRTVWGMWPHGGAWMLRHMWEHYLHQGDEVFLRERAWPLLRGHAEFYLDYLVTDPVTGKLVSGPSSSPENVFITEDGQRADIGMGNAMDQQIVWDLFTIMLEAAEVLEEEDQLVARVQDARDRLALSRIGADGRLMEWSRPFSEAEPGHRHISHLYGLHPGAQFTIDNDPAFVDAARKTLEYRLANGGGHTGWSRAWLINFFARLHDGTAALDNLRLLLARSTYPNMFDKHPPFQIDGNFGGAAGIIEMLVQSHARPSGDSSHPGTGFLIDILPALPPQWPKGSFGPVICRGGITVALDWTDQEVVIDVAFARDGEATLRVPAGWIFKENRTRTMHCAHSAGWTGIFTCVPGASQ